MTTSQKHKEEAYLHCQNEIFRIVVSSELFTCTLGSG